MEGNDDFLGDMPSMPDMEVSYSEGLEYSVLFRTSTWRVLT